MLRVALALGAIGFVAACADYLLQPQTPSRLPRAVQLSVPSVTMDDGQSARLVATVLDQTNQPFVELPADIQVRWSSSADSISSVDDTGLVTGNRPGQAFITAYLTGATGATGPIGIAASVTVRAVPTALAVFAGDSQAGVVGTRLPHDLGARVTDRHGLGVPGIAVGFVRSAGRGTLTAAADTTDSAGVATVGLTLDTLVGATTVEARTAVLPTAVARFAVRGLPGALTTLAKVRGDNQTAPATTVLPVPLVVRASDRYGNPVPGTSVDWLVLGGGGSVSAPSTVSDSLGQASATWTLGDTAGAQTARASISGTLVVTFAATAGVVSTANAWVNPAGGSWYSAANWSHGVVPGQTDTALIALDGTYTVAAMDGAALSVARLVLGASQGTQTLAVDYSNVETTHGIVVGAHGVLDLTSLSVTGEGSLVSDGTVIVRRSTVSPATTNRGTLSIFFGDEFLGPLTTTGTIAIALGGPWAGSSYGQLTLTGGATLGGTLRATLVNGYVPVAGDSFVVLTGGTLSGSFAAVNLPSLPAGTWQTTATASDVTLRVTGGGVATTPVGLSAGWDHTCAIASDNALWCWGDNTWGQLGDGTTTARIQPTPAAAGYRFSSVSAGQSTTCALTSDGIAYCWGDNSGGQLGNGSTVSSLTPAPVSGGVRWAQIHAGIGFTCGLAISGAVYCWGGGGGRMGNGTGAASSTPVAVSGGLAFKDLSLFADNHVCAITTAGQAYCWGYNYDGAIGDNTTSDRYVPTPVFGGRTYVLAASAHFHSCALAAGGAAYCWGDNNVMQLGYGNPPQDSPVPGAVQGGHTFTVLSAGGGFTCGLDALGAAWCWGINDTGGLGDGTVTWHLTPVAVSGGRAFSQISAGGGYACGLTSAQELYCWGANQLGQVGDGSTTQRLAPVRIYLGGTPPASGTVSWINPAGGSWNVGTNWNTGVVPTPTDTVLIARSGSYTVTAPVGTSTAVGRLVVGDIGQGSAVTLRLDTDTLLASGGITIQDGGRLDLAASTVTSLATVANGGTVQGSGTLGASGQTIQNTGRLEPGSAGSTAILTVDAAMLVNSVQATLGVRLGGTAAGTGYDRLAVMGSVIPAGTLKATFINGFAPSVGDTFAVMTYASRDGSFGTVTLPAAAGGVGLVADYTPTALVLRAVAASASVVVPDTQSVGSTFTCAIRAGALYCWGDNHYGQLADPAATVVGRPAPGRSAAGYTFVAVSAGAFHACGLTAAGAAYCWGENVYGELGDGTQTDRNTPVAVSGGLSFSKIRAGYMSTCGVTLDGAIYCWGDGGSGQLGTVAASASTPTRVGASLTFGDVGVGGKLGNGFVCGLTTGGSAYCWGSNANGQLGDGTTTSRVVPAAVSGGLAFTRLGSGFDGNGHSCGLTGAGATWCWGSNAYSALGVGYYDSPVPVQSPTAPVFASLTVGGNITCGLDAAGAAWCWGNNYNGAMGDGSTNTSHRDAGLVGGGHQFVTLRAGPFTVCGITSAGETWCWGYNSEGQVGDGTIFERRVPVRVTFGGAISTALSVITVSSPTIASSGSVTITLQAKDAAGTNLTTGGHTVLFTLTGGTSTGTLGAVTDHGNGTYTASFTAGSLGTALTVGATIDGVAVTSTLPTIQVVAAPSPITLDIVGPDVIGLALTNPLTITLGAPAGVGGVTVTITSDAAGTVTPAAASVTIPAGGTTVQVTLNGVTLGTTTVRANATGYSEGTLSVQVSDQIVTQSAVPLAVGFSHACLIGAGGALSCWGENAAGAVGDGTTAPRLVPTPAATGFSFVAVAAGSRFTCGLTSAGDAYCWGANLFGKLGNGTSTDSYSPVAVAGGLKFAQIDARGYTTCGLTAAGAAYCWGYNEQGQVGDSTTLPRLVPTPVAGARTFAALAVGFMHTCALTTGGDAYCWGINPYGEIGDGTIVNRSVPTPVVGGLKFGSVAAGWDVTCGLNSAGAAFCWGFNQRGDLGNGAPPQPSYVPGAVVDASAFTALSVFGVSCGLDATGAAFCWGNNWAGAIGDSTTTSRSVPKRVSGGLAFSQVRSGGNSTCGLTTVGQLYCWGYNADGEVGDGTRNNHSVPVPIALNPATQLAFAVQPSAATVGGAIAPAIQVTARDGTGNPVTSFVGAVTVAFGANPGGATLGGTLTRSAISGVATFNDLTVSAAGTGYTLVASATGLTSATSAAFDVTAPALGTIALDIVGPDLIGLNLTNPLTITLGAPAGVGGATVTITADAPGTVTPASASVIIPAGASTAQVALNGVTLGTTTVRANATGYSEGTLSVQVSDQIVARTPVLLSVGNTTACLIRSAGALVCWGYNANGQVGDGTTTPRYAPVPAATGLAFVAVATGWYHACGLTAAGDAYCWGMNTFAGLLGNGTTADSHTPVAVAGGLKFSRIAAGGLTTCALTAAGAAYCWGGNDAGQGGDSTALTRLVPTQVAGARTFADLTVGYQHACALTTGGAGYCWGYNTDGQVGDSTAVTRFVPTPVAGGHRFTSVTGGWKHTCAREDTPAGTTLCWGDNGWSQLGYGTPPLDSYVPGAVQAAPVLASLSASVGTCGLVAGGAAFCWGSNGAGALGDGTTTDRLTPTPVSGGLSFSQVSMGTGSTCGLTSGGQLYCWGYNDDGRVGDGTRTDRYAPVLIVP